MREIAVLDQVDRTLENFHRGKYREGQRERQDPGPQVSQNIAALSRVVNACPYLHGVDGREHSFTAKR